VAVLSGVAIALLPPPEKERLAARA
jgi:hypothetical protein